MSTCIVSEFPWAAIASVTKSEFPGVVVCTDTKVTIAGVHPVEGIWAKQQQIARNILVCYTSNNLGVTAKALTEVANTRTLRRIGTALRVNHHQYGGFTELIAVVWRGVRTPQVLEMMPPAYEPVRRSGVLGIGDERVLKAFRDNFFEEPRPDLVHVISDEARARLAQVIGRPVHPPRYRIDDGALNVAQALVEAIRSCRVPSVDIPVQLTCISGRRVTSSWLRMLADGREWTTVSAGPKEAMIPRPAAVRTGDHRSPRTAVQLFA